MYMYTYIHTSICIYYILYVHGYILHVYYNMYMQVNTMEKKYENRAQLLVVLPKSPESSNVGYIECMRVYMCCIPYIGNH